MRVFLLCLALLAALTVFACDDDDDGGDETPTSTAGTPTATVEPAIVIDTPAAGSTVSSPIEMAGTANVFEAVLFIEAQDESGPTLCERRVMATAGSGTVGDWSGVLAFAPPTDDSPATLRAYSMSPADGSTINLVERDVTVSAEPPNIVINSPACAEEVTGPTLTVEGEALVFEAALTVEVRDDAGTVLLTQQAMAESGTERSPWITTLDISAIPPGFYEVVAYSTSAEDGSVINEFPVQINRAP
jgi:hypothetical protein